MKIEDHQIKRNYTKGRDGHKINMVVIHIMQGYLAGTEATFNDGTREASAHYGIGLNGDVWRYVKEQDTAWHCGSTFTDNQRSIGIEHEGFTNKGSTMRWTVSQMMSSYDLTAQILFAYGLDVDAIVTHVSLHPKSGHTCPGLDFDLGEYKTQVSKRLKLLQNVPEVPALPPKPEKITMPLYYDAMEVGSISFTRSVGKAFYSGLFVSPDASKGGAITEAQIRAFIAAIGFGRILK